VDDRRLLTCLLRWQRMALPAAEMSAPELRRASVEHWEK